MWLLSISPTISMVCFNSARSVNSECNLSSTCVLEAASCVCLTPLTLSTQDLYKSGQVPAIHTHTHTHRMTQKII